MTYRISAFALMTAIASPAHALTIIDFDAFPFTETSLFEPVYYEDGYTISLVGTSGSIIEPDPGFGGGGLHFDDSGTLLVQEMTLTAPFVFDVFSFELFPSDSKFGYLDGIDFIQVGYENVYLEATTRDGIEYRETFDFFKRNGEVELDGNYRNLARFTIGILSGGSFEYPVDPTEPFCTNDPCSHFDVDNIAVRAVPPSAIPLPTTAGSMIAGLITLLALRRRRLQPSRAA